MKTTAPPANAPPWPFPDMVRAVLSVEWDFPEGTQLVPFLYVGKVSRPQYVFWPMPLPPQYEERAPE